jgi:hypothetical protein
MTCSSLGAPPNYRCNFLAGQNHSHYPIFIHNRKKTSQINLHKLWLPLHACDYDHVLLDSLTYALHGNDARYACWHFLAQSPRLEVLSPSLAMAPEMPIGIS